MDTKDYAPVVIPTLNRFEHFKRCLESLERCTGAEYTDVYVGLDYPPSEKYVKGWMSIDSYLKKKEKGHGFNKLYVRRRDHNCGAGLNINLLCDEVKLFVDRYIITEDDNEFSPCFLEYMNISLKKYKKDKRVVSVCGYTPFAYEGGENVYFNRRVNFWGVGRWSDKTEESKKYRTLKHMESVLYNFSDSMRLFTFHPIILNRVMDQVFYNKNYGDGSLSCYCVLNNKFCLYPSKSLVRNWGNDGSGLHCKKVDDSYVKREISQDKTFELDEIEVSIKKDIRKQALKVDSKNWYGNILIILRYLIWRITKIDIFSVRKHLR